MALYSKAHQYIAHAHNINFCIYFSEPELVGEVADPTQPLHETTGESK